jgi:hypothetical protein
VRSATRPENFLSDKMKPNLKLQASNN